VPREMHAAVMDWPMVQTGKPANPIIRKTFSSGAGLMRPLEVAAKNAGVEILLEHRMTSIYRQTPNSGPVLGIAVDNRGTMLANRAHKAVIMERGDQPAMSTSDACSTRALRKNIAVSPACPGPTKMPAAN